MFIQPTAEEVKKRFSSAYEIFGSVGIDKTKEEFSSAFPFSEVDAYPSPKNHNQNWCAIRIEGGLESVEALCRDLESRS